MTDARKRSTRRGRPAGLTPNPEALRHELARAGRTQAWLARTAGIRPSHVAELMTGAVGASPDVAAAMCEALSVPVGVLFPEAAGFRVEVRAFVARGDRA